MKAAFTIRRAMHAAARLFERAVGEWGRTPVHCCYCGCASEAESISTCENVAWCRRCRQVYKVPALKAPGWVTGVIAVLIINIGLL